MAEAENVKGSNGLDARKLASSGSVGTVSPHYGEGAWVSWVLPAVMLLLVIGLAATAIWLLSDTLRSPFSSGDRGAVAAALTATSTAQVTPSPTATAPPATATATATATASATATATSTPRPTPTYTPTATATPEPLTYTVVSGDSLLAIARAHGVELEDLLAVNDIENPSRISVGQVIIIPGPGVPVPSPTAPASSATPESAEGQSADATEPAAPEAEATAEAVGATTPETEATGAPAG